MLDLVEYTLMVVGATAVVTSLVLYNRRTGLPIRIRKILKGEIGLDSREFLTNRIGLYLLVMGVMVRYINQFN